MESKGLSVKCLLLFFLSFFFLGRLEAQIPEHFSRNDSSWYNRKIGVTKYLLHIMNGQAEKAIQKAWEIGHDVEADYVRAIAYAHLDKADSALYYAKASLKKDIDFNRYLAGDLALLQPLIEIPAFQNLKAQQAKPLVHGPMLGAVTDYSAGFWCRTLEASKVKIEVSENRNFSKSKSTQGTTRKEKEFALNLFVEGLQADTRYFYRVLIDEQLASEVKTLHTSPQTGNNTHFKIAFGGCAGYIPWYHHMWSTILSNQPGALLLLGDNVYIDYPLYPQLQQYCYYERQSEPHFRNLTSQVPVYAIWDDHDFGDNDDYGTPALDKPAWKVKALEVFKNQWVNPGYGEQAKRPGVNFNWQIGDVEFFFLDCRYYREPSAVGANTEKLSMLGKTQKKWLKDKLKSSQATFKVLISSVPWAPGAKPALEGKIDTWDGYTGERKEIFDFLAENKIEGLILLSADRHRSDIWKIDRENAYPLYEFESGRLTNTHYHKKMPGAWYSYNEKPSFGMIEFNSLVEEPYLEYQIINIDNVVVNTFRLYLKDLK